MAKPPEEQTATLEQALGIAVQHHTVGDLSKAGTIYEQILQTNPNHTDALHLLGVIAHQVGDNERAVGLIKKAIDLKPNFAVAHSNLGNTLKGLGKLDEAVTSYHRALSIKPDYAEAHNNLGATFRELGQPDKSVGCYHKALAIKADYAEAHNNLGVALQELGRLDEAVTHCQKALSIKPDYAEAHSNLGNTLKGLGKLDEAVTSYHKALSIKPDYAEAHNNLGATFKELGQLDESVECYQKALALEPDYVGAHNNLGNALQELGRLDEAVTHCQKALAIKSDYAEAHNNLGVVLQEQGRLEEAEQSYRRALEISPDSTEVVINLGNVLLDIAYNLQRTDGIIFSGEKGDKSRAISSKISGLRDEALACSDQALSLTPGSTGALTLKTSGLLDLNRLDDWAAFSDFDRLIQSQSISLPEGYEDLRGFNKALLQRCDKDPNKDFAPRGKSIKMGHRISFLEKDPKSSPVSLLLELANKAAKNYLTEHPIDPRHPFLAQSPRKWHLSAWSSILREEGHHDPHTHPGGWLSGVYYAKLPDVMETENARREGWILFGRPKNYVDDANSPEFRLLRPQEGLMVLFPSYFYHQTVPLECDDIRFTVAFDFLPLS